MRDEANTQTDNFKNIDAHTSTKDHPLKRSMELDDFSSDDDKSYTHMKPNMHSKPDSDSEEVKKVTPLGHPPKLMTTPQAKEGLEFINENKMLNKFANYNNKKSTIFSVKKSDEYDNNPYMIKIPDSSMPAGADQLDNNIELDYDRTQNIEVNDEVELEDKTINDQDDIPEIFKNSEIREKTSSKTRPRYFDSDGEGEGEYDFYEDYANSPNMNPPKGIISG